MTVRIALLASALLLAVPAVAQEVPPPAADDEGGLSVTVTDENAWQDLQLAIPSFATDRNQPTPANAQGTGALALELSRVVYNDLQFNSLFRPTGPDSLPRPAYADITSPQFGTWRGRGAEMLVQGFVRAQDDGRLMVGCYLYDVALNDELARGATAS